MTTTQKKLGYLVEDLKTSWYFRIWVGLWLICFITWLVALGVFAHRASEATQQKSWRIFLKDESKNGIQWPQFMFELSWTEINNSIAFVPGTVKCYFNDNGQPLITLQCTNGKPFDSCFMVNTQKLIAKPTGFLGVSHIQCSWNSTGWKKRDNNLVKWKTTQDDSNSAYIKPNGEAWVLINKMEFKLPGSKSFTPFWTSQTQYQSTIGFPNSYNVAVVINRYYVNYIEQYEFYNGLMSASDLGGFAFFLSLLVTVVMIIVGFVLDNDSHFLKS